MTNEQQDAAVFFIIMTCSIGAVYVVKYICKLIGQVIFEVRRFNVKKR